MGKFMKKTHVVYILLAIYLVAMSPKIFAQELVPATSEDIAEFDRQVAKQLERAGAKSQQNAEFGKQVSEEAKKLKNQTPEERKNFGKWVSDQRKKKDQGRPSAEGSLGVGGKENSRRMDGGKGNKRK